MTQFGSNKRDLGEVLRGLAPDYNSKERYYSSIGTVVSVDDVEKTAVIQISGGAEIEGVRLKQTATDDCIYIKPSLGSVVVVDWNSKTDAYIALMSEIDSISVSNSEEDLKQLISDLIGAIKDITVPTSAGTSGTPLNSLDFNSIETRFKKLIK